MCKSIVYFEEAYLSFLMNFVLKTKRCFHLNTQKKSWLQLPAIREVNGGGINAEQKKCIEQ